MYLICKRRALLSQLCNGSEKTAWGHEVDQWQSRNIACDLLAPNPCSFLNITRLCWQQERTENPQRVIPAFVVQSAHFFCISASKYLKLKPQKTRGMWLVFTCQLFYLSWSSPSYRSSMAEYGIHSNLVLLCIIYFLPAGISYFFQHLLIYGTNEVEVLNLVQNPRAWFIPWAPSIQ